MSFDGLLERPAWHDQAACRGMGTTLFFPSRGQITSTALRVCDRCPVRIECREWALANGERHGIWGGLSERQRRQVRRIRRSVPLVV